MVSRAVKVPARRVSDSKGGSSLADGGEWRPPGASGGSFRGGRDLPPLPKGPPPPLPGAAGQKGGVAALLSGGGIELPAIEPSPNAPSRPISGRSKSSMSAEQRAREVQGAARKATAGGPESRTPPTAAGRAVYRSNSASAVTAATPRIKAAGNGACAEKGGRAKTAGRSFTVQVVTWNMNQSTPAGELPEALLRSNTQPSDMYVVATQESGPLPAWERCVSVGQASCVLFAALSHVCFASGIESFSNTLLQRLPTSSINGACGVDALIGPEVDREADGDAGPHSLRLVAQETLWEIHIMVFARRSLQISNLRTGSVATGIGNMLGNKGGVGVGLTVGGNTRVLFLNSHFAAHDDKVTERNADYSRICSEMFGTTRDSGTDVTSEYDVTVWCGDFNYRVNSNRRAADVLIENKMWEVMRANDQLNAERRQGRCFKGFCEGDITFAPTFKFDNGTDTYDTSAKLRVPSWTDRVLWKCNPFTHSDSVTLKHYSSVPELKESDHRPVAARLEVSLRASSESSREESTEIKSSACAIQ